MRKILSNVAAPVNEIQAGDERNGPLVISGSKGDHLQRNKKFPVSSRNIRREAVRNSID